MTLSGANTYTGTTTVTAGLLKIDNVTGSGTGTGSVNVPSGTLGGTGIISGGVTIGDGFGIRGFLQPGVPLLRVQKRLQFQADGIYTCKFNAKRAAADQVRANGVTIEPGAEFRLDVVSDTQLVAGTVITPISNSSRQPINGTFINLGDGSTLKFGKNSYLVSYSSGDGNDLTLTVVP